MKKFLFLFVALATVWRQTSAISNLGWSSYHDSVGNNVHPSSEKIRETYSDILNMLCEVLNESGISEESCSDGSINSYLDDIQNLVDYEYANAEQPLVSNDGGWGIFRSRRGQRIEQTRDKRSFENVSFLPSEIIRRVFSRAVNFIKKLLDAPMKIIKHILEILFSSTNQR